MSFQKDDVVTFEDGSKILVLDVILHDEKEYLFVNVLDSNDEPTKAYKVYNANYQTGTLDKVTEDDLLASILPIFYSRMKQEQ